MSDKKVISIHDRIPRLREARKQRANRTLIFFLSIFFILILLIVYAQSSLSHVRTIKVAGNEIISDEVIVKASGITKDTNLWEINKNEIIKKIKQLDEIEHVEIKRKFPNSVQIIVKEYERIAYLAKEGKYFPIVETGKVLAELPKEEYPHDAPIFVDIQNHLIVEELASELALVPNGILNRISEIYYEPTENDPNRIIIYMNDGNIVHSTVRNFASRISAYPAIAKEIDPDKKGIIHMRMTPYFEELGEKNIDESER